MKNEGEVRRKGGEKGRRSPPSPLAAAITVRKREQRRKRRVKMMILINEGEGVARPNIKKKGKGAFGLVICFNVCVTYTGNYHNVLFQFKYTITSLHSP